MSNGARSRTSRRKVEHADEISRALDLKRAGLSVRKIAEAMKISVGKAHGLIERGIASIPAATRDALVAEIHERQLAVITAHWAKRQEPDHAKVIQASDKILIDMLGLEAPKRQELTGKDGAPIATTVEQPKTAAEIAQAVRELFGEHASVPHDSSELDTASEDGAGDVPEGTPSD